MSSTSRKGEKERERDLGMPVWWSAEKDVKLLQTACQAGWTNWRKAIASDASSTGCDITSMPAGFVIPPREGEHEWSMELTAKAAERRFNTLAKNLQPVKWLKLEQMKVSIVITP